MTTKTLDFDEQLAQATGYDVSLLSLARERTRSYFGVSLKSAVHQELLETGWQRMEGQAGKVQGYTRTEINALARHYATNDPMVSHALNLHGVYTFGRGVAPVAADERLQTVISKFWEEPTNRAVLSTSQAQYRLNDNRLLDGEVFFLLYVSTVDGTVKVRLLDPTEICDIVYADNDPTRPLYYKRKFKTRKYDFEKGKYEASKTVTCYLPDYRATKVDHSKYQKAMQVSDQTLVYVYRLCTNEFEGRGLSHFAPAIAWIRAFKGFMEDRVTLQMALALFAFKTKIKGNAAAIDRVMQQWGNYENADRNYGSGEFRERRPGSTNLFENEAMNMEQMKVDTGASNAYMDGRMLRQMVGVGLEGLFEHYLAGDASTGNLATATAMELPMLKMFEAQQELWGDAFKDILNFVIAMYALYGKGKEKLVNYVEDELFNVWTLAPAGKTDISISMRFPDIVARDVGIWLSGLAQVKQTESYIGYELMPKRESRVTTLELFGYEDAVDIALKMEEEEVAQEEENPAPTPPEPEETPPPTEEEQGVKPAVTVNLTLDGKPIPLPDHRESVLPSGFGLSPTKYPIILENVGELTEAQIAKLMNRVGKPLPKEDGEETEDISEEELDDTFTEFEDMPDLDDLLNDLGIEPDDLEDND